MVDPISQQIIQEIGNKSVSQSPVEPSTVSTDDAVAFNDMVNGTGEITASQPIEMSQNTQAPMDNMQDPTLAQNTMDTNAVKPKQSLGDRILQGLENTQNDIQTAKDKMATDLQGDNTINKMYELQLQVSQLATSQHVIGQVGSKTSQGIQTLLKGQ